MRELFPLLLNKLLLRFVPEILPIVSNPVRVSELIVAFLVLLVEPFLVVYSIKRSRRSALSVLFFTPSDMSFPFCSLELKKLNPSSMVFFRAEDGGGGFWPAVARDG